MLAYMGEVRELEKDIKWCWKGSRNHTHLLILHSRGTTRLLDLGQEVKYVVIRACLEQLYGNSGIKITTRKDLGG